ncbi:MAG: hypothetical protein N2C13_03340 [Chloroflexota bacterium]
MITKITRTSIFALLLILITGCGVGNQLSSNLSQEELNGTFEAQVAAAVIQQNIEATILADITNQTVEAALALTVAAGGEVVVPASTDVPPGEEPATDIPATAAPSNTPEPTATNTLEPTATFTADDPAVTLGNPDFNDPFNNANNWSLYDAAGSKVEIKDGQFVFTKKTIQYGSQWTVSWPKIEDYYLQVTARTSGTCSGFDRYGLIFRAPEPNAGLLFMVSCNGSYRLAKWNGSDMTFIVDWTHSSDINAGPNQTNRIGVLVQGSTIKLFANGNELTSVVDIDYVGEYRFGLLAGAADSEPFVVKFDDLAYWLLP